MGDQNFGRVVKQRRDDLGLSQARVGELVGRSASTIRNWERGRSTPSEQADVATLAAVLGLEERDLRELAGFEVEADEAGDPVTERRPTMEQIYSSLSLVSEEGQADEATDEDEATDAEAARPAAQVTVDAPRSLSTSEHPETEAQPELPTRDEEDEAEDEAAAVQADDVSVEPEPDPTPPSGPTVLDRISPDAGVPPEAEWAHSDPSLAGDGQVRGRRLARAAPPTVLETAPPGEPSYLEDPQERQRYRLRGLMTAAIVVAMVIVLFWSFDRTTDALGSMWDTITDMLAV